MCGYIDTRQEKMNRNFQEIEISPDSGKRVAGKSIIGNAGKQSAFKSITEWAVTQVRFHYIRYKRCLNL